MGEPGGIDCTIVMPAFNAARHIGEAIESVAAQSHRAWRLVVVDDGSTDGTGAVAARYAGDARVTCLAQPNAGVSAARNRGLAGADTPFVAFLDADDRWRPDTLARLRAALEAAPGAVLAYGESATIDDAGRLVHGGAAPVFRGRPKGEVLEAIVRQNFLLPGAALLRREAVGRAGPFDRALPPREDWEFFCRVAAEGPFAYVPGPPVHEYRIHAGGASHARAGAVAQALRAVEAIVTHPRIRARLADPEAARRHAEAGVYSLIANDRLREGDWAAARGHLRDALARRPMAPREWALLGCACARVLPRAVRARLK